MNLNELTIQVARKQLDKKEITSLQLTEDCLKAIKKLDKKLHACLLVDESGAKQAACEADKRIAKGEKGGLLGIPFLAKDNIMTKNLRTTAASNVLKNYIAPYDATVIRRLKSAGAILLGKTNLDEFAHGASAEYSAFGPTKNPWDISRVPGGSSGGSAAALAADFCLFALGTDTGGSVRHPAALCGVVGLKPSYGRCSRFGLIAMTSSTDVPGIIAKTTEDAALVFKEISGYDNLDSTSVYTKPFLNKKPLSLKGLKVGIPKEITSAKIASAVKKEFDRFKNELKKAGASLVTINMPSTDFALAAYYIITPSEISSNLGRFDGLRFGESRDKFGPEVRRRIILGTYCLSAGYYDAYYIRAQKVRSMVIEEYKQAFKRCDIILTPTTPTLAFKFGVNTKDPVKMYLEDYFLVPASLAGLPAISIPGSKKPLPIGLQLIAPTFNEEKLLAIAQTCETLTIDHLVKPNV